MSTRGDSALDDSREPIVVGAALAAGHDGSAEVSVALRYPNGAERSMSLSYAAVEQVLDAAGISTFDQLVGRSWTSLVAPLDRH